MTGMRSMQVRVALVGCLMLALSGAAQVAGAQTADTVHHSLRVTLDPFSNSIAVTDAITLPQSLIGAAANAELSFLLNDNLSITDG